MGAYLDLWDVTEGHPKAREELLKLNKVINAAIALIENPMWGGVSDEEVLLERALLEAGFLNSGFSGKENPNGD